MQVFANIPELAALKVPAVATVGFFDGVHLGHQSLIRELNDFARRIDAMPLVITFSNSPKEFHTGGHWQYLTLADEKLHLLEQCGADTILMLKYGASIAGMTARQFFEAIGAACRLKGIVAGYDSAIGCDMIVGEEQYGELANELGVELWMARPVTVDGAYVKSSLIRQYVLDNDLGHARKLMGRHYLIQGVVEHGKGKGNKMLSIPTANIYLPDDKLAPPTGIYAARAEIGGSTYPAAICIMEWERSQNTVLEHGDPVAPPASGQKGRVVEAYLIGFDGSLYGDQVRLGVVGHIRDWIDFDSADGLVEQITRDIQRARELCDE